jgi:hypothetical protein
MKKKTTTKTAATKTTRKATKKTSSGSQTILIHRIFIVSAVLTLFVVGAFWFNKPAVTQSVLGTSIMKGTYQKATIKVPADIPAASSYVLYYKLASEEEFTNSVKDISPTAGFHTVEYLKKGEEYVYRFAAVDEVNREILFSETRPITNLEPMQ